MIPYEELREDPIAQVRRALAFLGVPADEARLACLQNHLKGPAMGLQRQVAILNINLIRLHKLCNLI